MVLDGKGVPAINMTFLLFCIKMMGAKKSNIGIHVLKDEASDRFQSRLLKYR